jgi:hypothetical protein
VKIVASRFYMVRIGDQNLIKAATNKHRGWTCEKIGL